MVLSYSTSPAYHMIAEDEDRYQAAGFAEGHYIQVEVAAMTKSTDDPELARQFLRFMLTPGFQSAIPTAQWLYPVIDLPERLPPAHDRRVDRSGEHTPALQSLSRIQIARVCLKKTKNK